MTFPLVTRGVSWADFSIVLTDVKEGSGDISAGFTVNIGEPRSDRVILVIGHGSRPGGFINEIFLDGESMSNAWVPEALEQINFAMKAKPAGETAILTTNAGTLTSYMFSVFACYGFEDITTLRAYDDEAPFSVERTVPGTKSNYILIAAVSNGAQNADLSGMPSVDLERLSSDGRHLWQIAYRTDAPGDYTITTDDTATLLMAAVRG